MPGGAGVRRPDHPTTTRPTTVNGGLPGPESPDLPEAPEAPEARAIPEAGRPGGGGPDHAVPGPSTAPALPVGTVPA
ncbi:metal-binding protein, partial [Streptomyces sp. ZEA17I]